MEKQFDYVTRLDVKFDHLQRIDIPKEVAECKDKWFNQTLTKVNDSVVRLGIVEGEYHWHKHEKDDEFFFVLEGHFIVDLEDRSVDLQLQQGFGRGELADVSLLVEAVEAVLAQFQKTSA